MDKHEIENLLTVTFSKKPISSALDHFTAAIASFQASEWERCIAKTGKFVEAILKALALHAGVGVASGRQFKADAVMTGLGNLPSGQMDDTIRLAIPRSCRFVYDVASNRGARHDPQEIDPNEMDANGVAPVCSWILAEMLRYSQKGAVDPSRAAMLVRALTARRYPHIEEVDGRVYFHHPGTSAPDIGLLTLAYSYPKRVSERELLATIQRHGFRAANAQTAVRRIRRFTDSDGEGNLRLLLPGLQKAERIMANAKP